jgi:hypothetical protein
MMWNKYGEGGAVDRRDRERRRKGPLDPVRLKGGVLKD